MAFDPEIEAAFGNGKTSTISEPSAPDLEIKAAFPSSGSNYLLHPDPNVSRQSDQPVTPGTPIGDLLGKYNQWAGGQLQRKRKLEGRGGSNL